MIQLRRFLRRREGAISIVRLSGEQAVAIANKVYRSGTKDLAKVPTHTIHYGHIVDPQNDQLIDEVMLSVMRAPKTFTREDVVEINCHGGIVVVNQLLQLLLREGARMAEPGNLQNVLSKWPNGSFTSRSSDGLNPC